MTSLELLFGLVRQALGGGIPTRSVIFEAEDRHDGKGAATRELRGSR